MNTILCALFIILDVIAAATYIILWKFIISDKKKNRTNILPPQSHLAITFDECNNIIDTVVDEVYNNKYLLYYTLKETTIIPNLDEEVRKITLEIYASFSEHVLSSILQYYDKEYLVKLITRKVQLLLVDYINKHKPNVK